MAGSSFGSKASELYTKGRELMDADLLEEAIVVFQMSAEQSPHFKTLELLGECLLRSARPSEAVIPLAASVGLNKGVRAASLLAEAFLTLKDYDKANDLADLALSRDSTNKTALKVKSEVASFIAERSR
jgi:tetratricopeptide (TPR) repeat protein